MIRSGDKVRLTRGEQAELQRDAAENGRAVNRVTTIDEYDDAIVAAAPPGFVQDLVGLLETDAPPEQFRRMVDDYAGRDGGRGEE